MFSVKALLTRLLPANYFVILYLVVYIVGPYINRMFDILNKKQSETLVVTMLIIFSGWTILVDYLDNFTGTVHQGLSTVGMYGSQSGYSIVNFLLVYMIGAYIRRYEIHLPVKKAVFGIVLTTGVLFVLSWLEHLFGLKKTVTWNYNHPLVILMAVLLLLLFLNLEFHSRLINEISKAGFTCFLFHGYYLRHLVTEAVVNGNPVLLVLHQIAVSVMLYMGSYLVYKIYVLCSHWLVALLEPLCNKADLSFPEADSNE